MSGHSKWAQIKRQKGVADIKRGAVFTKLGNAITIAARQGGGDPTSNFKLRLAIEKARSANMPKENIERAIKRGIGGGEGTKIEEVIYEAYGPGGIALLIEVATDNRNRTNADVKSVLNRFGGKTAATGAVAYQFKQHGLLTVEIGNKSLEEAELAIIDAGAADFEEQDGTILVYTEAKETEKTKETLMAVGLIVKEMSLSWEPITTITIFDEKTAKQITNLMDALEDLADVTALAANFDIPETLLNQISS